MGGEYTNGNQRCTNRTSARLAFRFPLDHLERDRHEALELLIARLREQRLRPHVIFGLCVPLEQPADEGDHRDSLHLAAALRLADVLRVADEGLEAIGVAKRLGGERGDYLAETDVAVAELRGIALGAEKDRADRRALRTQRHDDDRAHVAQVQLVAHAPQHRVRRGIGDEHRLAALEGALELGIAVEIDDQVADGRVFVARDEPDFFLLPAQEDRAAVEAEGFTELACDGLQDVEEMERRRDLLQDVDDRYEMVTLPLELRDFRLESRDLRTLWRGCRR
jgi:hypothetical protein